MMNMIRRPTVAALVAALALGVAACGDDDDDGGASASGGGGGATTTTTTTTSSAPADDGSSAASLKDPGSRTIMVIPSTSTSEFLSVSIDQMKKTGAALGWKVNVCDGAGDVTKMERCVETGVTQKVDAIVTQAIGGPEIQKGAAQAKAAGVPLLASVTTVTPGFEKLYDGIFADDIVNMGKASATYIKENRADIPVVGEEITANYGGQGYINGMKEQFKADGLKFTDLRDVNLADIVNSMNQKAKAILEANKGPLTFIDFSDFGSAVYWKDIERAGRDKDVTLITRYDDPSTVKLMRSGANILVQVSEAYKHTFDLYQALLDKYVDDKPFPPTSKTVYEPGATVKGIKDFPEGSDAAFPFQPALDAQVAEWGKTYKLKG